MQATVEKLWPDGIVRIVRSPERLGLIRAKVSGAKLATGDVLVFLDAHCEVNAQWLVSVFCGYSCICANDFYTPFRQWAHADSTLACIS